MMYRVKVLEGEKRNTEIFRSENWNFARQAAENYKRDTGVNCGVESVTMVFVTTTLEEALARGATHFRAGHGVLPARTMADRTAEQRAAGFAPGVGEVHSIADEAARRGLLPDNGTPRT